MPLSESELHARVRKVLEHRAGGQSQVGHGISQHPGLTAGEVAAMIDHTALKADTNDDQIRELCNQALLYGFATVCVNPAWVPLCAALLEGSQVKVATVIGFPLGATLAKVKAFESQQCIAAGADELDMVINVGALKSRQYDVVEDDIASVVRAAHPAASVKVIIETCHLTDEEKVAACLLAADAGADFVKTSTGFGSGGATAADVALMRLTVGDTMGVKAAGGIRDAADALAMVAAGANRLGSSSGVKIVGELMEAEGRA